MTLVSFLKRQYANRSQNFNLIALKDSKAVEKLTRITILLAKVTILFLPVSLMTGYFSTELAQVKGVYTVNEYWVSFGVIMFLLNPRHVETIDLAQQRNSMNAGVQRIDLLDSDIPFNQAVAQVIPQTKLLVVRRNEYHPDMLVVQQEFHKRTDGSPATQVTTERIRLVIDSLLQIRVTLA